MRWQASLSIGAFVGLVIGFGTTAVAHRWTQRPAPAPVAVTSAVPPGAVHETQEVRHSRMVSSHNLEARNEAWAAEATSAYRSDLDRLGPAAHFRVKSLDCRAVTCLAEAVFDNCTSVSTYGRLLVRGPPPRYSYNCGIDIYFPPPAGGATCEASVLFVCGTADDAYVHDRLSP
jgi:hypothetical protein